VNHSRVCIELKRGDTLDLGDDNKFLVILLDPADEYDEDEDEADDVDEGKEEVALDRDNKEGALDRDNEDDKADDKKSPSYPKRRDDEDNEEPYPPTTAKAEVANCIIRIMIVMDLMDLSIPPSPTKKSPLTRDIEDSFLFLPPLFNFLRPQTT
jgi:hypothetical protein